jgi:hypothetical protein
MKRKPMDIVSKFVLIGLLFLLTLGSGLWVSFSGKPYNGLLFIAHKLLALASVIFIVIRIVQVLRGGQPQMLVVSLLALAGVCVIALFATGVRLSIGTQPNVLSLTAHRVALILLPLAMGGSFYLLA